MEPKQEERRLTTILAADVVGYSRLMGDDESGTLHALKAHRKELFEPKSEQYHGRTVKLMGDGTLMEFTSVVDAVAFAVEVQSAMRERNAEVPEDRQIVHRIGINIGDIIVEGEDIYGDGVNIASRLEQLAEPGGICVARTVFEQVKDKLDLTYENLGAREVKNIAEPIFVYRVVPDKKAAALVTPIEPLRGRVGGRRFQAIAAAAVIVLAMVGGVVLWQASRPDIEPVSVDEMVLPLPGKPSIAVLPFDNMSGDASKDYLSDGITEDIITNLSRFPSLFVIARNSTFTYKGQPVKVQEVSRDLGVRYILEGSFREAEGTVRVTAQLVDATTGYHLWAERYDRDFEDIFALQDELSQAIVAAISGRMQQAELERIVHKAPENLKAYELFLRGRAQLDVLNEEGNAEARKLFEQAITLDSEYARGHAGLALTNFYPVFFRWKSAASDSLERALELAQRAVFLDPNDHFTHQTLGRIHIAQKNFDAGIAEYEKAYSLNPNDADSMAYMGLPLFFSGRPEEAIDWVTRAMRLNPSYPSWYPLVLGCANYVAGRNEVAVEALTDSINRNPKALVTHTFLAAAYGQLGQSVESEKKVEDILGMKPNFSVSGWGKFFKFKNQEDLEHYLDGLRKAGLPE